MSLELVAVSRRYGKTVALDQVDLHVRQGDRYGFIGHNGAGKTTAMRIALGLQRADAGKIFVDGFDAERWPREARARLGGLIEVPGFHGGWSGRANLAALARLQGFSRSAARTEADLQFERVGLSEAGERAVDAYSHGMRQRLGIAQALLGSPTCVLLDEPTNGLDPGGIADVRALILRLASEQKTSFLISSHQLTELAGMCNRIGVLRKGRLLVEAETSALLGRAALRYRLETSERERELALARLAALGIVARSDQRGAIEVELGAHEPRAVARELVVAGVGLDAFAPAPTTLEEIYLRYTSGRTDAPASPAARGDPSAGRSAQARIAEPAERRAPRAALGAMFGYEARRIGARAAPWLLLATPALLGAIAIARRAAQARSEASAVAGAEVFSATDVTAFEGVGRALQAGLPWLVFLALGLASQSVAGELARGTLRNVLLRPLKRTEVALGKALACVSLVLGAYVLLALVALGVAGASLDFGDVTEILPNGARYALVSADELWPELRRTLVAPILPLVALTGLGFLAGTIARTGAGALGLALGLGVVLDLARTLVRGLGLEGALPASYLPSLLGDTSLVQYYVDVAQGVSNADFAFRATAVVLPAAWIVLTFGAATALLARKAVN